MDSYSRTNASRKFGSPQLGQRAEPPPPVPPAL